MDMILAHFMALAIICGKAIYRRSAEGNGWSRQWTSGSFRTVSPGSPLYYIGAKTGRKSRFKTAEI